MKEWPSDGTGVSQGGWRGGRTGQGLFISFIQIEPMRENVSHVNNVHLDDKSLGPHRSHDHIFLYALKLDFSTSSATIAGGALFSPPQRFQRPRCKTQSDRRLHINARRFTSRSTASTTVENVCFRYCLFEAFMPCGIPSYLLLALQPHHLEHLHLNFLRA